MVGTIRDANQCNTDANVNVVPALLNRLSDELDQYTHGSRYYNIKQFETKAFECSPEISTLIWREKCC